jgi:putative ABC transport system permease protein
MDFRPYVRERLPSLDITREAAIVHELAEHLEDLYREARGQGLDHEQALARAAGALPAALDELADSLRTASRAPRERVAERILQALEEPDARARSRFRMLTDLKRDCRHALRTLVREPGFTAAVTITLALGIGATSTIFSGLDAILFKRMPIAEPARAVNVYSLWAARATSSPAGGDQLGLSSYPDYVDLRDSGILKDLVAFADVGLSLDANGVTERIEAEIVSGNYFDVLGVRPVVGRTFGAGEDRVGSPIRVAVLSHRTWLQRFGGDRGLVGRSIALNGNAYTVIGIAPQGFAGTVLGNLPEAWVPMALQVEVRPPSAALQRRLGGTQMLLARDVRWLGLVGRLRDAATLRDTAAALDVTGRQLAAAYPQSNRDISATAVALGDGPGVRTRTRSGLALLTAAVALVLTIACANVASLLLARAVTRRREVAVRMAIGAGSARLLRQWLTEAVILGVLGATAGLIVANWGAPILYGLGIPDTVDLALNPRVLALTLATGLATGLIFGVVPALQLIRMDTLSALRDEGSGVAVGARATRLRSAFVVVQVALSFTLLVGAGLFIRTLQQVHGVDPGYQLDRMLVADIAPGDGYSAEAGLAFYDQLLERLNALPGVVSAGAARVAVLSGAARTVPVSHDGQPFRADGSNVIPVRANVVSDRYLESMGIRLLRGRNFHKADGPSSPRVAIVSQALVNRLWPNADPIGQSLVSSSKLDVVGVVPDTVYASATERDPRPFFYVPLSQGYESSVALHVRTIGDPLTILPALRQAVREIDTRIAVTRPRRLADEFERSIGAPRTMALLVGALSGIALLLAAVGLYGVMAYTTRQRTAEVGLRLALGASRTSVLNAVMLSGARLIVSGAGLGIAGAFVGVRYVRTYLFGVEPTDPLTWLTVSAVLVLVGLTACAIPARRAMRIDPAVALRR